MELISKYNGRSRYYDRLQCGDRILAIGSKTDNIYKNIRSGGIYTVYSADLCDVKQEDGSICHDCETNGILLTLFVKNSVTTQCCGWKFATTTGHRLWPRKDKEE